jgi:protein phosphatase
MARMTIGAFARSARLSPKALRLYDELGLLKPVSVDDGSGYRYYEPDQLERARLIAWLRRIGLPLARIRDICEMKGPDAAAQIAAYWREVEAETSVRARLVTFLVEYLSGTEMAEQPCIDRCHAARSDAR